MKYWKPNWHLTHSPKTIGVSSGISCCNGRFAENFLWMTPKVKVKKWHMPWKCSPSEQEGGKEDMRSSRLSVRDDNSGFPQKAWGHYSTSVAICSDDITSHQTVAPASFHQQQSARQAKFQMYCTYTHLCAQLNIETWRRDAESGFI